MPDVYHVSEIINGLAIYIDTGMFNDIDVTIAMIIDWIFENDVDEFEYFFDGQTGIMTVWN
jgi:hypothetical protein